MGSPLTPAEKAAVEQALSAGRVNRIPPREADPSGWAWHRGDGSLVRTLQYLLPRGSNQPMRFGKGWLSPGPVKPS
jgi:hypothetical protein